MFLDPFSRRAGCGRRAICAAVPSLALLCSVAAAWQQTGPRQQVTVVVGAQGEEAYGEQFRQWGENWKTAAERAGAGFAWIGHGSAAASDSDRQALMQHLQQMADAPVDQLWIVLIGHGTFDGDSAKFNLRGPDVSAVELAQWLEPLQNQVIVINCASASGPYVNALSSDRRVVITSTNSGYQYNFARFGQYLSQSIMDPRADLDKDEQTSLLEAFLAASAGVADFYDAQSRLATEHALLEDNGDQRGTPADWFRGIRAVRTAGPDAAVDGRRANQLALAPASAGVLLGPEAMQRRNDLEQQLEQLLQEKPDMDEPQYYAAIEPILLELARLYDEADRKKP